QKNTQQLAGLRLTDLAPLERAAGDARRDTVMRWLVSQITAPESGPVLWAMDFPFSFPTDLGLGSWDEQLRWIADSENPNVSDAKTCGRYLVDRCRERSGTGHVKRETDRISKTPFDSHHYRIIYQTFHGMRDVLGPLRQKSPGVCVLPFDYQRLNNQTRVVVVESCPSSTLKRFGLPHHRYKSSGGKTPTPQHRQTRQTILRHVTQHVSFSQHRRGVMMKNPGGDALDAVLAGYGAWSAMHAVDHRSIQKGPMHSEGYVYA
ncbi:MAG: DUF429 domain-containing protein, partial [Planctomycetota bacterium]